ncbi:hypothetical protein VitviT2T_030286 [Vitis vinifera]|uniref:Ubiquitin-like domain-containing protein n=1 Tax=Vitis vinifera TaxID=29760 RepID=A0ABY9E2N4_VITVI|nr:hypothetical protein VitviT2T_030286 [Vitis vinifera]
MPPYELIPPQRNLRRSLQRCIRSTLLRKLMSAYSGRQSVELNSIAFLFDGCRLRGEQTPDELEMKDGDEINAMLHQTGRVAWM